MCNLTILLRSPSFSCRIRPREEQTRRLQLAQALPQCFQPASPVGHGGLHRSRNRMWRPGSSTSCWSLSSGVDQIARGQQTSRAFIYINVARRTEDRGRHHRGGTRGSTAWRTVSLPGSAPGCLHARPCLRPSRWSHSPKSYPQTEYQQQQLYGRKFERKRHAQLDTISNEAVVRRCCFGKTTPSPLANSFEE